MNTYSGYLTLTTRPIKAGERIMVDYDGDYFPKCICDTCAGGPRKVGKGTDNRVESMEGKGKRKRENRKEKKERWKRNKAVHLAQLAQSM